MLTQAIRSDMQWTNPLFWFLKTAIQIKYRNEAPRFRSIVELGPKKKPNRLNSEADLENGTKNFSQLDNKNSKSPCKRTRVPEKRSDEEEEEELKEKKGGPKRYINIGDVLESKIQTKINKKQYMKDQKSLERCF